MDVVLNNTTSTVQGGTSYGAQVVSRDKTTESKKKDTEEVISQEMTTNGGESGSSEISSLGVQKALSKTDEGTDQSKKDQKESDSKEAQMDPAQKQIQMSESLLQYKIEESEDKESGEVSKTLVVYLLDKESGEVIRRIPPEEFNDPYKKQLPSKGIFIDQTG